MPIRDCISAILVYFDVFGDVSGDVSGVVYFGVFGDVFAVDSRECIKR